eukprot:g10796.t1
MRETLAAADEIAAAAPAHGGSRERVEPTEMEETVESEHLTKVAGANKDDPRWQQHGQDRPSVVASTLPPASNSGGCGGSGHTSGSLAGVSLSGLHVHLDMPPPPLPPPVNLSSAPLPRPGSVQRLLEKEGPDARNVVSWLVRNPCGSGGGGGGGGGAVDARVQAGEGGGLGAAGVVVGLQQQQQQPQQEQQQQQQRGASREGSRERERSRRKSPMPSPFKGSNASGSSSKGGSRGRSGSDATAQGFNQRLWGYLFRNVNRAVDELYYLCEAEGSSTHCAEAAELLEGCGRDFTKLVERIADQKRFEEEQRAARAEERERERLTSADKGSPLQRHDGSGEAGDRGGDSSSSAADSGGRRPKGLVWEVRKTTAASTASAMVLNAIERMESQASPKDPSSSAALHAGGPRGLGSSVESPAATTANAAKPSETCPRSFAGDSDEGGFADHDDDNSVCGSDKNGGGGRGSEAGARPAASFPGECGEDSPASLRVAEEAGNGALIVGAEPESESKAELETDAKASTREPTQSVSWPSPGMLDTVSGPTGPDKHTSDPPGGHSCPSDSAAAAAGAVESASKSIRGTGEGEGDDKGKGRRGDAERCRTTSSVVVGLPVASGDNTSAATTTPSAISGGSARSNSDNGAAELSGSRDHTGSSATAGPAPVAAAADGNGDGLKDGGSNGGNGGGSLDAQGGSTKSTATTVGATREGEAAVAGKQPGSGSSTPRKVHPDDRAGVRGAGGDRLEEGAACLPAVAVTPKTADSRAQITLDTAASPGAIVATVPRASTRKRPTLEATDATAVAATTGEYGRTTAGGSNCRSSGSISGAAATEPGTKSDFRARQTSYRLNPRAAPFTYKPGGFATTTATGGGRHAPVPGLFAGGGAHAKPRSTAAVAGRKIGQPAVVQAGGSNMNPVGGGAAKGTAPQAPPETVGVSTSATAVVSGGGRADGPATAAASGGRKPRAKKKKSRKKEDRRNGNGDGKVGAGDGGKGVVDSRRASVVGNGGVVETCHDGRPGGAGVCDAPPPLRCPTGAGAGGVAGAAAERLSSLEGGACRRGADAAAGVHKDDCPDTVASGAKGKGGGGAGADGATGTETERPTQPPGITRNRCRRLPQDAIPKAQSVTASPTNTSVTTTSSSVSDAGSSGSGGSPEGLDQSASALRQTEAESSAPPRSPSPPSSSAPPVGLAVSRSGHAAARAARASPDASGGGALCAVARQVGHGSDGVVGRRVGTLVPATPSTAPPRPTAPPPSETAHAASPRALRVEEEQIEPLSGTEGGNGGDAGVAGTEEDEKEELEMEGEGEGEVEEDCDDPDSAYVNAMEEIWAAAEAWVDAEAQAEEEAWARLPTDVSCCPDEPEGGGGGAEGGGGSDVDDRPRPATPATAPAAKPTPVAPPRPAAAAAEGAPSLTLSHRSSTVDDKNDADKSKDSPTGKAKPTHTPARCGKENRSSDLGVTLDQSGSETDRESDRHEDDTGGTTRKVFSLGDGDDGDDEDDHPADVHVDVDVVADELLELEIEIPVEEEKKARPPFSASPKPLLPPGSCSSPPPAAADPGHPLRRFHSHQSQVGGGGGSSGGSATGGGGEGDGEGCALTRTTSGSGASCFGVERGGGEGSSHAAFDEGWGPFSHRELQKKLSSPQRKPQRKILSAAEAKLRQERRQMVAELNRAQLASGMAEKLKQHEERARGVRFRKEEQLLKAEEEVKRRMEEADARRKEHRRGIVRKANDANSKVEEVIFMNKLTVEDLKITLQMRLAEVDRRIQLGRARRQQLLMGISDRQRKRTRDKAAQMSERRLEAESAAAMRWEALQKRLEAVQQRRRDREKETSRRMQAADRHSQARERRKAMLHHPARGTEKALGKAKSGRKTAWIDSRRKGAMAAAAAAAPVDKQGGDDYGDIDTHTDRTSGNRESTHGAPTDTTGVRTANTSRGDAAMPPPQDSVPTQPPPSSAGSSAAVGPPPAAVAAAGDTIPGTTALFLATTACQRRGRAQKKRARKVKDSTRRLCLEAAAVPIARGEAARSASSSSPCPWPRLERAARELGALVSAKARLAETKLALQATAVTMSRSAASGGREDVVTGLSSAVPAADPPVADARDLANVDGPSRTGSPDIRQTSSAIDHPGEGGLSTGTGATAAVAGSMKGGAVLLIAEEAEEGLNSGDGGGSCSSNGGGGGGGDSDKLLRPSHRKTRRGKRAGGAINRRRGAKERAASCASAAASAAAAGGAEERDESCRKASENPDVAESRHSPAHAAAAAAVAPPPAGKELKLQGEIQTKATNGVEQSTQAAACLKQRRLAAGAGGHDIGLAVTRDARGAGGRSTSDGGKAEAAFVECVSEGHTSCIDRMAGVVDAAAAVVSGVSGDRLPLRSEPLPCSSLEVAALEDAAWRSLRDLRVMCSSSFSSASASSPSPSPSAASVTGRQSAASPRPSASSSSPDRAPSTGTNATAKTSPGSSAEGRLCQQARLRGVLDSLVAICAPFPWTPAVSSSLDSAPAASNGTGAVGRAFPSPAAGVDAAAATVPPTAAAAAPCDSNLTYSCSASHGHDRVGPAAACAGTSADVSPSSANGMLQEDAVPGRREAENELEDKPDHVHAYDHPADHISSDAVATVGMPPRAEGGSEPIQRFNDIGCGSGSTRRAASREASAGGVGREAMSESALDVLLALLAEEPRNRDYVLRIDGGAPLVDCLSRLLERATRHGDTTKNPPHSSRPPAKEAGTPDADDGTTIAGVSSYEAEADASNTPAEGGEGTVTQFPASCRGLCGREVPAEVEVEAALLGALGVVSVLIRHETADTVIARIQEGVVRYLMAKRLLADLSVLVYQLHPFCASSASASASTASPWPPPGTASTGRAARRHRPNAVGNSKRGAISSPPPPPSPPSRPAEAEQPLCVPPVVNDTALSPRRDSSARPRSPTPLPSVSSPPPPPPQPVLVLRRKAPTTGHPPSNSRSPPLLQLAGRAVELVEAVASHLLAAPAPAAASGAGGARPPVSAASNGSRNHSSYASTGAGAPVVCRSVEELRCGSLCFSALGAPSFLLSNGARTGTAGGSSPGMEGVSRAVGSLVSLLAAIVGAEKDLGEQQRRRLDILQVPCASPQSHVQDMKDGGRRPRNADIMATPATAHVSEGVLHLAGFLLRAANRVCLVDLTAMQEVLSMGGLQPEFSFLCDHLLGALMERVDAQEPHPPTCKPTEPEDWLASLVTLLGYFCLDKREHQETLRVGPPPTILGRLCNLPFRYFSEPRHRAVLFPTLIAACHEHLGNAAVASSDLAMELLAEFLEGNLRAWRADDPPVDGAGGVSLATPRRQPGARDRDGEAVAALRHPQCPQTKDFNYSRVSSKTRRRQQIDDLDEQLRQEQESSRRLRAAVSLLKRKLDAAEEGRRRSNGLERAFFSHLVEAEALVLQRDRLMAPGNHHQRNTDETELAATDTWCWESDAIMQAYRVAAAGTVQKLASALFGRELLAVEAAKTSAAERERMVEERAKALFESQVSLQVERDQLQSYKASLRAEVREAKVQLEDARKQYQQQQDMVKDAERVHSSLSWRILTMQVARDKLAEAVGERLRVIQVAVRRRVGFLPWAVERAVNDLVGLCSTAGPTAGDGAGDGSYDDKALRLLGRGDGTSGSTSTSRSSSFRSSS